jgi:hypothetical protein
MKRKEGVVVVVVRGIIIVFMLGILYPKDRRPFQQDTGRIREIVAYTIMISDLYLIAFCLIATLCLLKFVEDRKEKKT